MIEAVAHDVNERVGERLDDVLVGFGLLPFEHQLNFFAQLAGDIAHHPGEALEDEGDSHHADLHDGVLHLVSNAIDDRILAFDFARNFAYAELRFRSLGQIRKRVFPELSSGAVAVFALARVRLAPRCSLAGGRHGMTASG